MLGAALTASAATITVNIPVMITTQPADARRSIPDRWRLCRQWWRRGRFPLSYQSGTRGASGTLTNPIAGRYGELLSDACIDHNLPATGCWSSNA